MIVYRDAIETYHAITRIPRLEMPYTHELVVEWLKGVSHRIRDKWGNEFRSLDWFEIKALTWIGKPLFTEVPAEDTELPKDTSFHGDIVPPWPTDLGGVEPTPFEGTTFPPSRPRTHPPEEPIRYPPRYPSSFPPMDPRSYPPRDPKGYPSSNSKTFPPIDPRRPRYPSEPESKRYPPPREPVFPTGSRGDAPKSKPRQGDDEFHKMRPLALQKLVKKYDGSKDPYDHVAAFRQAIHAEQVTDTHTQFEGFGLTLESKALSWFQTLESEIKTSFERLEKDFIVAFSKMGIKHNAVGLISSFKQKDQETVRDCVNKLKQYIARFLEVEKPSQTRLVSIFLEILRNKTLHAHLYAKKHSTFNSCCMDAMDYDENCELSMHDNLGWKELCR